MLHHRQPSQALKAVITEAGSRLVVLSIDADDPVAVLLAEFDRGLDGLAAADVRTRLHTIETTLDGIASQRKMYGHTYDDALTLKYLHQRYLNYLAWLDWQQ